MSATARTGLLAMTAVLVVSAPSAPLPTSVLPTGSYVVRVCGEGFTAVRPPTIFR